jgi:gas vesicle protein
MMQILLGAAVGAAAAYFFDPQMGNGRRIRLRDQAMARVSRGADAAEGFGQDVANRAYGMAHEAGDAARSAVPIGTAE